MKVVGVIPVRFSSTRFPGKPLAKLKNKPIIQWVYENAKRADLDRIIIATDDERIFETARSLGAEVWMTSSSHRSGTERVAEIAKKIKMGIVLNIQGDEVFLKPKMINFLIREFKKEKKAEIATLATPIKKEEDLENPNVVKVVFDRNGYALYFSRSCIPYLRNDNKRKKNFWFKHIGIYAYKRKALLNFVKLPLGRWERMESLEQLRALENNMRIKVVLTKDDSLSIDTPEDLKRAEEWLK